MSLPDLIIKLEGEEMSGSLRSALASGGNRDQATSSIAVPPSRLQLSRAKGWRMPENTVVVSRPSKWGNPFDWRFAQAEWGATEWESKAAVAMIYRDWLTMREPERFHPELRGRRIAILANLSELRGKNLACWCKPGAPCHADVLLELANRTPEQRSPSPLIGDGLKQAEPQSGEPPSIPPNKAGETE
jgi:hypothetical protein